MSADNAGNDPLPPISGGFTTTHRYELPLPRKDVWSLICDVSQYRAWWPWLRDIEADALTEGEEWRCQVQPPVPYLVRFGVVINKVDEAAFVRATVTGDVIGHATLTLEDADAGCTATLDSSLAPGNRALRVVNRFAAPVARFGHDWVLDTGARQFIARAVDSFGSE